LALSIRQTDLANHKFRNQTKFTIEITNDPKIRSVLGKSKGVPIRLIAPKIDGLVPSTIIEVTGSAVQSKEAKVSALIFANKFRIIKKPNHWQKLLANVRDGLRSRVGIGDGASLIPGMVLGDTTLQSSEFAEAMRRSGLTHLTAVSGANFAIVSVFLLWLMQWPVRNLNLRLIITALFLIAFIGLVRPSPSVLRAAAMSGVVLFAKLNRNRSDSIPALGFAIAVVVICDPWQARDPGFALSVLATTGILLISPKLKIPEFVAIPISATILCTPIIIGLSGYLSFASIPANILSAPLVAPITVLGFISAIFPPISPIAIPIAKLFAILISEIAWIASGFPVLNISTLIFLIILIIVTTLKRKFLIYLALIFLVLTWLQRWPNVDWQIANCDVGQGDALVVNLGHGQAAVFDTGPEPKLMRNCLRSLGIKSVPLVLITHAHKDHAGGIFGVPNPGKVITAAIEGDTFQVGDVKIEILWPTRQLINGGNNFEELSEEGSALNNQSIVARVTSPKFSLLVTGDIEPSAQEQLIPLISKVDVYKVAHHGSKYQNAFFTKKLEPKYSIISVGHGNKYGHPNQGTLELLASSQVLRTDLNGAVAIDMVHNRVASSKVGVFGLPVFWRVA
jgi:competence protein ComEC